MGPMGAANRTSDTSMTHIGSNARKVEGVRALSRECSFTGRVIIAMTQKFKTNSAQDLQRNTQIHEQKPLVNR